MTDQEPHDEHAQYVGGSAAEGRQTYGSAEPPFGPQPTHDEPVYPLPRTPGGPMYGSPQPMPGGPADAAPSPSARPPFGAVDIVAAGVPEPKRRLAPVMASVVAVLAIVLGGGGFTAYKLLASGGGQPEKWAPANSIAFAKTDLDPSASAKVAAWEFEQKFPGAPKVASADQLKDALLKAAFQSDPTHPVNYDADVKPWLGDRVAFAVFLDRSGKPQPIGILEVKDAGKAKAGLASLNTDGGSAYSMQGDYVIVGKTQSIVDEAVTDARKSNIGSNSTYTGDIAHLKTDRIVTAWWDAGASLKAEAPRLPGAARGLLLSGSLTGLPDMTKAGRLVMGLRVQPAYVELEGRVVGGSSSQQLKNGTAGETLGKLPSGTVAGIALANPEQLIQTELNALKSGAIGAGVQGQLDAVGAQLGISLPADFENLLGSELAVGLDAVPGNGGLGAELFTVLTHPDDLAKGLDTAKKLANAASASGALQLTAATSGSSVVITDNAKHAAGTLGDDPVFKSALDGMPSRSALAGFIDLSAIVAAEPAAQPDAKQLQGLGFYAGVDSTSPVFAVKLTVK